MLWGLTSTRNSFTLCTGVYGPFQRRISRWFVCYRQTKWKLNSDFMQPSILMSCILLKKHFNSLIFFRHLLLSIVSGSYTKVALMLLPPHKFPRPPCCSYQQYEIKIRDWDRFRWQNVHAKFRDNRSVQKFKGGGTYTTVFFPLPKERYARKLHIPVPA
jgi:hypothetical protein